MRTSDERARGRGPDPLLSPGTGPAPHSSARAILALQRSAGNRAARRLLRKSIVDVKAAAKRVGIDGGDEPQIDVVDEFLASRRDLFQVTLVGTSIHVRVPRSHAWTARYTSRALTEAAVGAAISRIYMGGASAAQVRKAYEKVVGGSVRHTPASKQQQGEGAFHRTIIDDAARKRIGEALNLPQKYMTERWRASYGEAMMVEFALDVAHDNFDKLVPHFPAARLARSNMSVELVRHMLQERMQSLIEVARRHPAAAPWRAAYRRNLALHWAEREPILGDLDRVPLSRWATTVLELATAARDAAARQIEREREEDRRHARNEHLRPHEIEVKDAAAFILENFEPTHTETLHPNPWTIRGGQRLTNIKNEPIFLLRVETERVVFQHLGNKRFYEQTLEGFGEEQIYSVYALAGAKSLGAIALSKWVIGLAGAVFPPVRYGLMATDVLNAAARLQSNRAEIERLYDSVKLAYANVDALVPGVLPLVWEAVLDKRNAAMLNPLENPDPGTWLKVIIRLAMMRQARVVEGAYAADAVSGFLEKAWAAVKKGVDVLWEVVKHVIVVGPAVAGSTGVGSIEDALDVAQRRLREIGVLNGLVIVNQIRQLPEADQRRLVREIQDLSGSGTQLIDVVRASLSW